MTSLYLKKLIGAAMMPLSVLFIVLALGVVFLWVERLRNAGRWLVTAGLVLFLLLGYGFPGHRMAGDLESQYPAVHLQSERRDNPAWIVVLGGGHRSQSNFPPSSRLMEDSLYRLVEGIRLHRQIDGSRLVIAGGAIFDSVSSAEISAGLAEALGVESGAIIIEKKSRDTEEEALSIRQRVGDKPFYLVTSAMHMPRAVFYFQRMGMHPIPAPTQHRVQVGGGMHPSNFFPSVEEISLANAVAYETLGMYWARLRNASTR